MIFFFRVVQNYFFINNELVGLIKGKDIKLICIPNTNVYMYIYTHTHIQVHVYGVL